MYEHAQCIQSWTCTSMHKWTDSVLAGEHSSLNHFSKAASSFKRLDSRTRLQSELRSASSIFRFRLSRFCHKKFTDVLGRFSHLHTEACFSPFLMLQIMSSFSPNVNGCLWKFSEHTFPLFKNLSVSLSSLASAKCKLSMSTLPSVYVHMHGARAWTFRPQPWPQLAGVSHVHISHIRANRVDRSRERAFHPK